ncbi:hypothetical protein [Marinitoga aeolica]|uniref:Phosphatidate cytidylyltransferase n=1 Tax=Marinitoga aeolica TaxID=2809031 RepID=A0ABY8PTQ2_9BACT|nr:hypothetical protein [Marinitoga aeolica]WGS65888.1 hypothetical protein JRV97_04890 [Marinitoga aeolica]
MRKYLFIIEIALLFLITILVSLNYWFSLLYLIVILIEIYKDIFSKNIDEMDRYLRYKTSNITLYIVIGVSAFFLTMDFVPEKELLIFYTLFPLLLKNLLYIGYMFNREKVIKRTGYTIFLILALFTILSHGFSVVTLIEMSPWLLVLFATWLAVRYRILGAIVFFGAAALLTFLIFKNEVDSAQILTFSLIVTPLLFLGFQTIRKE